MRKADIVTRYDHSSGRLPALNVKYYGPGYDMAQTIASRLGCSVDLAEQALGYAIDSARERFWELAEEDARSIYGGHVKTYADGRSGGWLVVDGLYPLESWDAVAVAKWARFARYVRAIMDDLGDIDNLADDIEANRWAEEGAERFNFRDIKGQTVCTVDVKRAAAVGVAAFLEGAAHA